MQKPPQKTEVPNVLFQYRPPEPWAFGNLSRQVIYFGSPRDFNDPYDCDAPPKIDDLTDEQHDIILRDTLKAKGIPLPLQRVNLVTKEEAQVNFRENAPRLWRERRDTLGIACFSGRYNNPLMWSHYGGRGAGFCLAFDAQDEKFFIRTHLKRVHYSAKRPYGGAKILFDNDVRLGFFSSKSENWRYEQEWRLFRSMGLKKTPDDREEKYDAKTLKAVYFGTEATEDTKYRVYAILGAIYPHAKMWEGYRSESKYEVCFNPYHPPENWHRATPR